MAGNDEDITFELNRRLYTLQAIEKTAKEFANICRAKIGMTADYFEVILTPETDIQPEYLEGEFCNHCLALSKHAIIKAIKTKTII